MRVFLSVLVLFFALPVFAQDMADSNAQDIVDEIPDEFLIEAENYAIECSRNSQMNLYYNCECMGGAYLDERIRRGPNVAASSIRLALGSGTKCKDASGIAGQQYENCFNMPVELPDDTSPQEYCECYANEFAKEFESTGGAFDSKQNVRLMRRARITCGNQDLKRRLRM